MPVKQKYTNITPKECLDLSFEQSFDMLKQILPESELKKAFDVTASYPSPLVGHKNTKWSQTAKIIGINPRITGTYWGIIKYAMTFPENAVHIMPLWETGDGSLYVQNSWDLNPEFFDKDLCRLGFNTFESQLKLTVNILHALGKIVGFDTLPHVDNFSEIVILNPKLFEWVKLNDEKTAQILDIDYNSIYKEVENCIIDYLCAPENLFSLSENKRKNIIFPANIDKFIRRMELRKVIRDVGFEPIPVVEHAPMRPVLFDRIETLQQDNWAVFKVKNKANHAKIIGSVTPYKWYKTADNGYPVKNAIENDTWNYFIDKVYNFQKEYNFDFLRADMAHNQISHSHNEEKDMKNPLEMWAILKKQIQRIKPYFAAFAEAFYTTYYIDGLQDMQNKDFDIVLGDMNFKNVDENYFNWIDDFLTPFRENFSFHPCVTIFTNDGDLPGHNQYFKSLKNNCIRYFISMFLNLPSYMGMGYETRNLEPELQQEFSNEYVKKQNENYIFGNNLELLEFITKMRSFYSEYKHIIENNELSLIESESQSALVWSYVNNNEIKLLFIVKLDENADIDISNDFKLIYSGKGCLIYET